MYTKILSHGDTVLAIRYFNERIPEGDLVYKIKPVSIKDDITGEYILIFPVTDYFGPHDIFLAKDDQDELTVTIEEL
jgi:hypothetical protein